MSNNVFVSPGGTGAMAGRTYNAVRNIENLYSNGSFDDPDYIIPYKDQGNRDRALLENTSKKLNKLCEGDSASVFFNNPVSFQVMDISQYIREQGLGQEGKPLSIERCVSDENLYKMDILLSPYQQAINTEIGYAQQPEVGCLVTNMKDPFHSMFKPYVEKMFQGETLNLVIPTGTYGSEGLSTSAVVVNTINKLIDEVGESLDKTKKEISDIKEKRRKILFLPISGCVPPCSSAVLKKGMEHSAAVTGTLAMDYSNKADGIISIDSPFPLTISGVKDQFGGDQKYHCALPFLLAAKAAEKWLSGDFSSTDCRGKDGLYILYDPLSEVSYKDSCISYSDLNLPKSWKPAIGSFINFATVMLLAIYPQIKDDQDNLKYSEFLHAVYGNEIKKKSGDELRQEIVNPILSVCEICEEYLQMLFEIGVTGTDWSQDTGNGNGNCLNYEYRHVSIFNAAKILEVLDYYRNVRNGDTSSFDLHDLLTYEENGQQEAIMSSDLSLRKAYEKSIHCINGNSIFKKHPCDIYRAMACIYNTVKISGGK